MSSSKTGGKNPMFGQKHSEEVRAKMLGKIRSEETRTKIREIKNISIEVSNLNTGETNIYSSGIDASISLGCSPATITRYAKNGMLFKGIYKIRKLI